MPTLITSIQHSPGDFSQEKERKVIQMGKQEIQPALFADDRLVLMEKSQEMYKRHC